MHFCVFEIWNAAYLILNYPSDSKSSCYYYWFNWLIEAFWAKFFHANFTLSLIEFKYRQMKAFLPAPVGYRWHRMTFTSSCWRGIPHLHPSDSDSGQRLRSYSQEAFPGGRWKNPGGERLAQGMLRFWGKRKGAHHCLHAALQQKQHQRFVDACPLLPLLLYYYQFCFFLYYLVLSYCIKFIL